MIRSLLVAPVVALVLALAAPDAAAGTAAAPLRIHVDCQGWGRTKACPAFLLGFVDASPLLLSSPRSDAQVVLYYNVTPVANVDRVHLRFVGTVPGAPPVVEAEVELDTRAADDDQRAQLEPAFLRGAALFVAALHPDAVEITLAAPDAPVVAPTTTPWGFEASIGGWGSWTRGYQSLHTWTDVTVSRLDRSFALRASIGGSYGITRQPPLVVDGVEVPLDLDQYSLHTSLFAERHLGPRWSVAAIASAWHEDPDGQYRFGARARAGIEWDRFAADDPRGNRLAIAYLAGAQVDRYNVENELGERAAAYPIHGVFAGGTIRKDKIGVGLDVEISGELLDPARRHVVSGSPFLEIQLGDHVDLELSVSVTRRALPAPVIDPADFEQVIRASYAEPLNVWGNASLRFHWDRTNGQRNDRFSHVGG